MTSNNEPSSSQEAAAESKPSKMTAEWKAFSDHWRREVLQKVDDSADAGPAQERHYTVTGPNTLTLRPDFQKAHKDEANQTPSPSTTACSTTALDISISIELAAAKAKVHAHAIEAFRARVRHESGYAYRLTHKRTLWKVLPCNGGALTLPMTTVTYSMRGPAPRGPEDLVTVKLPVVEVLGKDMWNILSRAHKFLAAGMAVAWSGGASMGVFAACLVMALAATAVFIVGKAWKRGELRDNLEAKKIVLRYIAASSALAWVVIVMVGMMVSAPTTSA